jgi:hypothetical protein
LRDFGYIYEILKTPQTFANIAYCVEITEGLYRV